ncbi:MAG: type II secretion system F family protein [Thermodesulfobacteriota bacterium]
MPAFKYRATDASGNVILGDLEAREESSVVSMLQSQGYIPIAIEPRIEEGERPEAPLINLFQRVPRQQVINFTREMSSLLKAGLPIDRSLKTLIGVVENKRFRGVLKDLLRAIEQGSSVADALAKFPGVFPTFYISMVRAGEASGTLDKGLLRLAALMARAQELRNQVVSAMIYPAVLVAFSGLSIVFLLTYVIPRFAMTFSEMGDALPVATVLLMKVSATLIAYWWVFILAVAALYLLFRAYTKSAGGGLAWDRLKLGMPMVGDIIRNAEVVRFSRTMGTLLEGGVPPLRSLEIVGGTINNRAVAESVRALHDNMKRGEGLGVPLKEAAIFSPMAVEMIAVGEETGRLDEMLLEVADTFEQQLKERAKRFLAMLEPLLIIVMGLIVGFIVVSMLLAIFSVNDIPF